MPAFFKPGENPATDLKKFIRELFGFFLIFCALLLLIGLFSYNASDPSLNHVHSGSGQVHNKAGLFGAYAAGFLDDIFGLGALIWPAIFAVLGAVHLSSHLTLRWWRWTGFFLLTLCFMTAAAAFDLHIGDLAGGGIIGNTLQINSTRYLSPFGAFLLWLFIGLTGLQLSVNFSWVNLGQRAHIALLQMTKRFKNSNGKSSSIPTTSPQQPDTSIPFFHKLSRIPKPDLKEILTKAKQFKAALRQKTVRANSSPASDSYTPPPDPITRWDDDDPFAKTQTVLPANLAMDAYSGIEPDALAPNSTTDTGDIPENMVSGSPILSNQTIKSGNSHDNTDSTHERPESHPAQHPLSSTPPNPNQDRQHETIEADDIKGRIEEAPPVVPHLPSIRLFKENREFELPSPDLLDVPPPQQPVSHEALAAKGKALMNCFQDFDINGELARITPGPVVTMFEVRPAAGIRVSRISNLSDDLGLALKAVAVRIQAPIPGSDTVGIEIPNDHRETVSFRELVESSDFASGSGPLTMILGKTIAGHPFMADLTRMPHMLVAGATGAGKSVCLNSILMSFLYRHPPDRLKLLLVDPKRIEMAVYSDLPHLVHPVVTEMDDAKNALAWAVQEMENRFKTFMRLGVRNITAYHDKLDSFGGNRPENLADLEPLPYMVIVIDELADLMLTAARDVEPKIQRLAQLARAAGIHMILATQRPSVDVVTGLIKAQFPCRISFQVSSKHDSRTILDQVGAEHLLGRGDMLFKPAGGKLLRLHGPFVSDEEVQAVVAHWKAQQKPNYQVDFSQWGTETASAANAGTGSDATSDPLYHEARNFVLEQGRASISLLQRHLKIGFNRAARLMEQFERDGLIGPADGSKPRAVIR